MVARAIRDGRAQGATRLSLLKKPLGFGIDRLAMATGNPLSGE